MRRMMALNNSNIRLYQKLEKNHKEIMNGKNRRQCVNTLDAMKNYIRTYRRIVEAENKDARFLYA